MLFWTLNHKKEFQKNDTVIVSMDIGSIKREEGAYLGIFNNYFILYYIIFYGGWSIAIHPNFLIINAQKLNWCMVQYQHSSFRIGFRLLYCRQKVDKSLASSCLLLPGKLQLLLPPYIYYDKMKRILIKFLVYASNCTNLIQPPCNLIRSEPSFFFFFFKYHPY